MDITKQILEAAATWPGLARVLILLLVVSLIAGGLGYGIVRGLRFLLKGKKLETPLGTVEDKATEPGAPETCYEDTQVGADEVDEVAFAHPSPIMASVLDRQLDEVYLVIKTATNTISGGIQNSDPQTHIFKRSQVQIVFEAQVKTITKRLIYNGLHRLKDGDVDGYCKDRAGKVMEAFETDLEDRLISLGLDRMDLHQSVRDRKAAVLSELAGMYRTCVQIAKEAHRVQGCA